MGPTTTGFAVSQHILIAKQMRTCCEYHSKTPLVLIHASTPTHRRGALVWSRRSVFTAVISVMPWLLETSRDEDISSAVSKIQRECAPFISKMENSRKFLYRGGQLKAAGKIQQEESDLLDPSTYSEEGALYFKALDAWISDHGELAGLGHIAVADVLEAGQWGKAMSCWPRGEVSYLWLSGSRLLFDDTLAQEQQLCSDTDTFLNRRGVKVNQGMASALEAGHEIMFLSAGYYLFPSAWDAVLQDKLFGSKEGSSIRTDSLDPRNDHT